MRRGGAERPAADREEEPRLSAGPSTASDETSAEASEELVPFGKALRTWTRVALESFGGPAGQIAVMHRILVEEKRWIGEERFLHALSYCMLLPGPEAQQLAIYLGWLLHRTRGGLAAGILFVLPGFLTIWLLSLVYVAWGELPLVAGIFFGVKAAVLALVLEALLRIGRRALGHPVERGIAVLAFVAIFLFGAPFPAIVLAAGLGGWLGARLLPEAFRLPPPNVSRRGEPIVDAMLERQTPAHTRPSWPRAARILAIGLTLWWAPIALLAGLRGRDDVFTQIAFFFSKLAVVTFGGAYAVLAYMAQQAVDRHGWVTASEMLDGLGMAETTPGPLIQVVQFVGFLAAHRSPGNLAPWLAGSLAAALTTWVTFVPCFLWIFLGAPWIERLRESRALRGALAGITAAVVGVILDLTVWFSLHTLFGRLEARQLGPIRIEWPVWSTIDPIAATIALLAAVATLRFHVGVASLIGGCAAIGVVWRLSAGGL